MLWENLREEEFKEAIEKSNGVCIVPVGCLEKHGQHLPVGCDTIIGAGVCEKAAELEYAVVFPTMFFGEKTGAGEFAGTVIFSAKLRWDILNETCKEIARNGFKKILLVSSHGGNGAMLGNFSRSVLYEKNDYMVFDTNCGDHAVDVIAEEGRYDYLTEEDRKYIRDFVESGKRWGHAGIRETSLTYAIKPETVRLDKITQEDGLSTHRFDEFSKMGVSTPFAWMANYPNSYGGDHHEGVNERIAKALFEHNAEVLAKRIKFLKEETISNEYQKEWAAKQK
ncbi:MAG: creatininase family protein [Clostridia bacterium]|nr:creatininase family protein [Clostridia bacterium]